VLEKYLNISVRPGFEVPMQVLDNAYRAKQEKLARDAVFKMMDDQIWAKAKGKGNAAKARGTCKQPVSHDQPLGDAVTSPALEIEKVDTTHAVPVEDVKDLKTTDNASGEHSDPETTGTIPVEDAKDLKTTDNASGEPSDPEKTCTVPVEDAKDLKITDNASGEPSDPETTGTVPVEDAKDLKMTDNASGEPNIPESVPGEPSATKAKQAKKDKAGKATAKAKAKNCPGKVKKETKKSKKEKTGKCEEAGSSSKKTTKKEKVDEEQIAKRIHCVPQLLMVSSCFQIEIHPEP
jgi:hypothetical protein